MKRSSVMLLLSLMQSLPFLNENGKTRGTNKITFNRFDLAPGIYNYELTVTDERRDAGKRVVMG